MKNTFCILFLIVLITGCSKSDIDTFNDYVGWNQPFTLGDVVNTCWSGESDICCYSVNFYGSAEKCSWSAGVKNGIGSVYMENVPVIWDNNAFTIEGDVGVSGKIENGIMTFDDGSVLNEIGNRAINGYWHFKSASNESSKSCSTSLNLLLICGKSGYIETKQMDRYGCEISIQPNGCVSEIKVLDGCQYSGIYDVAYLNNDNMTLNYKKGSELLTFTLKRE